MAHLFFVEFIRLPTFERSSSSLFGETDLLGIEIELIENPNAGDLIPHGRGLRKLRRPASGRGKRGGSRVIYYHVVSGSKILLIYAYAKNQKTDLDQKQLKMLSECVKAEFQ